MSAPAFTDGHHDTDRPATIGPTYETILTEYSKGWLSESVMRHMLLCDDVFSAFVRKRECVTHARLTAPLRQMAQTAGSTDFPGW